MKASKTRQQRDDEITQTYLKPLLKVFHRYDVMIHIHV